MKKNTKLLVLFVIGMLFLDQITKFIFWKNGKAIIPNEIQNNGYNILISIIAIILILRYLTSDNSFIKMGTKLILCFALTGVIGNVIDRIIRGYVIVFINIGDSLYFNFAYLYILITWIGMAVILTKNTYKFIKEKRG